MKDVARAQAETLRDWARQYNFDNAIGASEAGFCLQRAAAALEGMADGKEFKLSFEERQMDRPLDEPKPD